ncbi:MAG: YhjD/YihY/BrkB family envelope integrity protein, partial [Pseudorhodoplanes sp.]
DTRSFLLLRIESVAYVLVGMLSLLAFSFLIVLAPLIQKTAQRWLPRIELFDQSITLTRYAVASTLLIAALFIVHMWLPAGRRSLRDIYPGIAATLVLWLVAGALFGRYLADYAFTYSFYYAGLASPMIALVFLYVTASIFIYGGELNSEILKAREKRRRSRS